MSPRTLSRREFLKAACLTGSALALGACTPKTTQAPEAIPTEEPKTISFWYYWTGIWGEACTTVANKFMETKPNIKVEAIQADWEKILAAFAAGSPPDVLLDFSGSQLMPRKQVLGLDELIATSKVLKKDNYFPDMLNSFQWDGVQYGFPAAEAGVDMGLVMNTGLVEAAGLDPANPPQTIDELLVWGEKLTITGDGGILSQVGFDPLDGTSGQGFYNWAALYGKNWWDASTRTFDWQALAEPFRWQADWINRWGAVNFEAFRSGFGGWLEPDSSVALGTQALHINGYWTPGELFLKAAKDQKYAYTWVPTPANRKGVKVQTSLPTGIFLPIPAKSPNEAFLLLEYICSDEANQVFFNTAGGFSWTKSWLAKVDTAKYPGLDFYVKSIAEADELYSNVQNCPLGFSLPQDEYTKALNAVIYDNKPVEDVLNAAQKTCEEELARILRG